MESELIEKSLQDKIIKMHIIAFKIEDILTGSNIIGIDGNNKGLTENEMDLLYGIVDGLTEKFIMDRVTGHCSLQDMLDNPIEKLENIIDIKIVELIKINDRYNLKIDIYEIDTKIANMQ